MEAFEINGQVFEWDDRKAASNIEKHGISFYEAASAFSDEKGLVIPDPKHPLSENRFLLIGQTGERKLLTVIHVDRQRKLRIISARPASRKERRTYEQPRF